MDINLEFNTKEVNSVSASKIHYMPCSVDFDGEAAIKTHFMTYIKPANEATKSKTGSTEFEGSFRGYPLRGETTAAPKGYSFVLMKETKTDVDSGRTVKEKERFDDFTFWNVSTKPNSGDPFHQTLRWMDVAKIIHDD